jgi:hypothetical protein
MNQAIALSSRGIQDRLVDLVRIARHPVEPVRDQKQGPVHIGADPELEGDLAASRLGPA